MSRHSRFVPLASGLVLAASWSCGGAPTCRGDWCGTAIVVTGAEADVLLPPVSQQDVGIAICDLLYLKLADVGPSLRTAGDSDFVPQLAQSWRWRDSLTLELALAPEARWHDGTPVTAGDVSFTFEVYRDTLVGAVARSRLERIDSVVATDSRTVVFHFSTRYAEQFFDAVYHMRIVPRHLLDSVPHDRLTSHPFGRHPVGSGPFRFVRWTPGELIEVAADSAFFLGRPGLRRVIWRFTSDAATALSQLLADEADALNFLGGPDNVRRVEESAHLRVVEYPSAVYAYVQFNLRDPAGRGAHALFADRDLRRALTMAIDREAIVQAIFGGRGRVPPGPVSPALWIWRDDLPQLPYDTAAARRLLAARGWTDKDSDGVLDRGGRRLAFELSVPTSSAPRRQAAQIIQDQLRRIGVEVEIAELEFNAFLERAGSGRFDAVFGSYGGDISPASIGEVWTSTATGGFNYGRYANPAVDALVQQAMDAGDAGTALARWHRAVAAIVDDAPAIWIYTPMTTAGIHRRFENVTLRPDQWASTLWTWRVPAARLIARDRFAD